MLRGIPREKYSADDMARIYFGLGSYIGKPLTQSYQGDLLGHVIDVSDVEADARHAFDHGRGWRRTRHHAAHAACFHWLDAGTVVNFERAVSQFEGAAVFGTSLTLMSEITAMNGMIQQGNFNQYRVARMSEAPMQTNVTIVKSDAPPAGIGEPGVPPIAPAICNAIFAATGKRIRELPIAKQLA